MGGIEGRLDRSRPNGELAKPRGVQSAGSIQRARHPGNRLPQPFGWVSKHAAPGAGCTYGCALRVKKCATGASHEVSSSVPARRLMVSGLPSRSP